MRPSRTTSLAETGERGNRSTVGRVLAANLRQGGLGGLGTCKLFLCLSTTSMALGTTMCRRFGKGWQPLFLTWLQKNKTAIDGYTEAVFIFGNHITEICCQSFPGLVRMVVPSAIKAVLCREEELHVYETLKDAAKS